jgi:hypothetical protein
MTRFEQLERIIREELSAHGDEQDNVLRFLTFLAYRASKSHAFRLSKRAIFYKDMRIKKHVQPFISFILEDILDDYKSNYIEVDLIENYKKHHEEYKNNA